MLGMLGTGRAVCGVSSYWRGRPPLGCQTCTLERRSDGVLELGDLVGWLFGADDCFGMRCSRGGRYHELSRAADKGLIGTAPGYRASAGIGPA
jgi:hypothetical protein